MRNKHVSSTHRIKAFSFVEIIIVVAIIALLSLVGIKIKGDLNQKSLNTKSVSLIQTIGTSLTQYHQETGMFPNPKGNISYYSEQGEYVHIDNNVADQNDASLSFGKHGFVTDNLLPKKYLNFVPLAPRTNQFYAYGKTTDNDFYEVAGIVSIDGKNTTTITGNYPGETGPYNLIREYNGPDFVYEGSVTALPYNPDERRLTAQIDQIKPDSTVKISTLGGNTIIGESALLEYVILPGDTITVSSGGAVKLYYSDGSQSTLGDPDQESVMNFSNMDYKTDTNLITKIHLALNSGTLWTKAPSLGGDSEFEVYTQDTAASVRGTIFGVQTNGTSTTVEVQKGSVAIKKVPAGQNGITIVNNPDNKDTAIFETLLEVENGGGVTDIGGEKGIKADTSGNPALYNTTSQLAVPIIFAETPITRTDSPITSNTPEDILDNTTLSTLNGETPVSIDDALIEPKKCLAQTVSGYDLSESLISTSLINAIRNTGEMFSYGGDPTPRGVLKKSATFTCQDNGGTNGEYVLESESSMDMQQCDEGFSQFILDGDAFCEAKLGNKTLHAFAPYDDDLTLYYNASSHNNIDSNKIESDCDHGTPVAGKPYICETLSTRGISFDNTNNTSGGFGNDWLEYRGVDFGDDFVVEVSVKGSDLKRDTLLSPTFGYTLFSLYNNGNLVLGNRTYQNSDNSNKVIGMGQSSTNYGEVPLASYTSISNDFVTARSYITTGSSSKWSFEIQDNTNIIDLYSHISTTNLNKVDTLRIGANSTNSSQWDGIIDFVKIYQ